MKPYYQDKWVTQYWSDALKVLPELPERSIDLLVTDPPYGIGFMGKDWDKALPDKQIWQECFRVLKDGAFAFVMSIPRADCLSRMIISLEDAGFWVNFTPIFWAYASGFPKAQNIGKAVDKRLGTYIKGEVSPNSRNSGASPSGCYGEGVQHKTIDFPQSPQAKALEGSYGGFQPKLAVEVIIVAMKPLSEKTFVDQALKNKKGITWLDEGRIPYDTHQEPDTGDMYYLKRDKEYPNQGKSDSKIMGTDTERVGITMDSGRFPANLLVSDDVLNDGRSHISGRLLTHHKRSANSLQGTNTFKIRERTGEFANWGGDSGSFSRYFDLDKWFETFPFLIVPKASRARKKKAWMICHRNLAGAVIKMLHSLVYWRKYKIALAQPPRISIPQSSL